MKLILIATFFLVLSGNFVKPQILVQVVQYILPDLNKVEVRCTGTLLTNQHVLTTASCAKVSPPYELAVKRNNLVTQVFKITTYYEYSSESVGNIAIVQTNREIVLDNKFLYSNGLQSNQTCRVHDLDKTGNSEPRKMSEVLVYSSQFCGSNNPNFFCSVFVLDSEEACSMSQGSPVICDDGLGVQGFVISNQTCQRTGDSFQLNYLSIQSFAPWIKQVLSSYFESIDSREYLIRVYEITEGQSFIRTRCVGTVIGPHHILTTASCVVDSKNIIGVEGKFSDRLHSYMTEEAEKIYIHPDYKSGESRTANIAIIQIRKSFDIPLFVNPLAIGNISAGSNPCQLVGWSSGRAFNSRRDVIGIYDPSFCDPNFPEVYCSTFPVGSTESCDAALGSPLICVNETIISGFLLNENECSVDSNGRLVLNFHSVHQYKEWINDVTGGGNLRKISISVLILTVLVFLKNV